jgi:hypothetical protein
MKHPRYLVVMILLCLMFWSAVAWSCHGAPGGTPSPRLRCSGQKEIWRPRGSDLQPAKKTALCLIQDQHQAKLIPRIVQCARARDGFGNRNTSSQWVNYSPVIRSIVWTVRSCGCAKEYLAIKKPRNQRHNRLLNTNRLVDLRRLRTLTT